MNRHTAYRGFKGLNREIVECERCPRLRAYARLVAESRPPRFAASDFWGRPVPGFGDLDARLLIIGLAPARTGALRTGRIFTGDASSRFLTRALYAAGFANQPSSESLHDGLVYHRCYVTAAVKCAPPSDKPTAEEFENCSSYLDAEIAMLPRLKVVLALGAMAFLAYLGHLSRTGVGVKGLKFAHGRVYRFSGRPTLLASYHPSPRNTNTGLLTEDMLLSVLRQAGRESARI